MDQRFEERRQQLELIEKFQKEIEELLQERPQLRDFQQKLEEQLQRIGNPDTPEGRSNRLAYIFGILREQLFEFQNGLEDYRQGLEKAFSGKRKPQLRLLK